MVAPQTDKAFVPRTLARTVLKESATHFNWVADLTDLKDGNQIHGPNTYSIRFTQEFKGLFVDSSEVVVNMYHDSRVYSIYNNYHYDIPNELDPQKIKVDAKRARAIVERLATHLERHEVSEPKLIVYQYSRIDNHPKKTDTTRNAFRLAAEGAIKEDSSPILEGTYFLAWDTRLDSHNPTNYWRILVNAMTGRIIQAIDLLQYSSGTGEVFDPNPIVNSGDTTLSSSTPIGTLDGKRTSVTINRLDPATGGNLRLHRSYVQMDEFEAPTVAEPLSLTGDFNFSYADVYFLDTMAYFHIDRFQDYIQTTLMMNNVANFSIHVDPQGVNGDDNSHYNPGSKNIAFGGGITPPPATNHIPDAGDAMVVLHEYGHEALKENMFSTWLFLYLNL